MSSSMVSGASLVRTYSPLRVVGRDGSVLVAQGRQILGGMAEGLVRAWHLDGPVPDDVRFRFSEFETTELSWMARLEVLGLLRTLRLPRAVIGSLLGLPTTLVSRLIGSHSSVMGLVHHVDKGSVTISHVVAIAEESTALDAAGWMERTIVGKWSVRELRRRLGGSTSVSADARRVESLLSDGLGTEVRIRKWDGTAVQVGVAWFGLGDLVGLFERLAKLASVSSAVGSRREFVLDLSLDELDGLFGEVLREL